MPNPLSTRPDGRPFLRLRAGLIASGLPRFSRIAPVIAPVVAALALAACKMPVHQDTSAPPSDPYTPAATQLLDNTQWQLAEWKKSDGSLRAIPGAADTAAAASGAMPQQDARPITLDLSTASGQRRASGFSGCNRYTGSYTLKDGLLSFGPLAGTRMACVGAGGEIEGAYLDALTHIAHTGVQMRAPQALLLVLDNGDHLTFAQPASGASAAQPGQ
jgi:heat shock protein HslJ